MEEEKQGGREGIERAGTCLGWERRKVVVRARLALATHAHVGSCSLGSIGQADIGLVDADAISRTALRTQVSAPRRGGGADGEAAKAVLHRGVRNGTQPPPRVERALDQAAPRNGVAVGQRLSPGQERQSRRGEVQTPRPLQF